ncbi:MAG: transglutaminase domain-containing protein [Anaerolineae bacterium]|nr:transglutaminase domain-containing protein [Anaerolineae bacterium]
MRDMHTFYTEHSPYTDPGEYAPLFDAIPDDIASIARTTENLLYHYFAGQYAYGYVVPGERRPEIDTRYVSKMLARLMEMDDSPLTSPRDHANKVVGCCRDFSTMFCAIARHKGIPCRVRYGFGAYFGDFYGDHVVGEYWDGERWVLVDAQMSPAFVKNLNIQFNVLDVPRDQFIVGGDAWLMIREQGADPNKFCVTPDMEQPRGTQYVLSHVVQDIAGLNKAECLCWDEWGLSVDTTTEESVFAHAQLGLIDEVAELTRANNPDLAELQRLYQNEVFQFHGTINCWSPAVPFEQMPLKVTLEG